MDYEWDENKRQINLQQHQVDFAEAYDFQWETAEYEVRTVALGYIGNRLYRLIVTERDGKTRVISLRKANSRERRHYDRTQTESHQPDA